MSDTTVGQMNWVHSRLCQFCGTAVLSGQSHFCGGSPTYPGWNPVPQWPHYPPGVTWPTFTLEDIRKIVREELDRKPTAPSAFEGRK